MSSKEADVKELTSHEHQGKLVLSFLSIIYHTYSIFLTWFKNILNYVILCNLNIFIITRCIFNERV